MDKGIVIYRDRFRNIAMYANGLRTREKFESKHGEVGVFIARLNNVTMYIHCFTDVAKWKDVLGNVAVFVDKVRNEAMCGGRLLKIVNYGYRFINIANCWDRF